MLGKIISPEQSKTKANDFLNLWLKMRTNYRVVAADNLLEGRMGVANEKRRLRSSRRLPYDLFQSNSMLPKLNPNFHQWYNHNFWATNVRWGGRTLSRVNAEYGYSRQSTLKLWLNKSVMTKSGCLEEDFVMHEITDNKSILQKTTRVLQRLASRLASLALGS